MSSKNLVSVSLAAVGACSACCALPLLGSLGLGSLVTATLVTIKSSGHTVLFVAGTITVFVVVAVRLLRTRMRRAACTTECEPDGSCCGSRSAHGRNASCD